MKKLGMAHASTISRMYGKLRKQGLSVKSLFSLANNAAGFTVVSDEELKEYKGRLTPEELEEFDGHEVSLQKIAVATIKEKQAKQDMIAEFIDEILVNYCLVENELAELVAGYNGMTEKDVRNLDLEAYMKLLVETVQENMSFFTSVASLNIKK